MFTLLPLNGVSSRFFLNPQVSDKKNFSSFPYMSQCKTCDPPGGLIFWPQGHNLNKLNGRGPLDDASYQGSSLGLVVSDKKIFSCFPYKSLCKIYDPRGRHILVPEA